MAGVIGGLIQLICVPAAAVGAVAGVVGGASQFFSDVSSGQSLSNIQSPVTTAENANNECKTIVTVVFIIGVCLPVLIGAFFIIRCVRRIKREHREQEFREHTTKLQEQQAKDNAENNKLLKKMLDNSAGSHGTTNAPPLPGHSAPTPRTKRPGRTGASGSLGGGSPRQQTNWSKLKEMGSGDAMAEVIRTHPDLELPIILELVKLGNKTGASTKASTQEKKKFL